MMETQNGVRGQKVPLTLHHHFNLHHYWYLPLHFHPSHLRPTSRIIITRLFRLPHLGWGVSWINSAPLLVKSHYESRICYTTEDKACSLLHYSCRSLHPIISRPFRIRRGGRDARPDDSKPVPVSHSISNAGGRKKKTARSAPKARAPRCREAARLNHHPVEYSRTSTLSGRPRC